MSTMPRKKTHKRDKHTPVANAAASSSSTCVDMSTFPVEIIMMIVAAQQLTPRSFQVLTDTKLVNRRFYQLITEQLKHNLEFRKLVHSWTLFVPGTLIPYRAKVIPEPVYLEMEDEILEHFEKTFQVYSSKNIAVSDIYVPITGIGAYGTWEDPEDDVFYYMTITIYLSERQFTRNLPLATSTRYDVSGVPNVVRSVLNMYETTSPLDNKEWVHREPVYLRLVRVHMDHTMQDIYDAVAGAEGWGASKFIMHEEHAHNSPKLHSSCSVSNMVMKSRIKDRSPSPHMQWPSDIGNYTWRDFFMTQFLNMVQQNACLQYMFF